MAKRAANVSIRRDLLDAARASNINLSATLEAALAEKLKQQHAEQWRSENREAIKNYNEQAARLGVFSDSNRTF